MNGLKIPQEVIAAGLKTLDNAGNPGRANVYHINGVTVFLDFAHNPAGLEALMPVIEALPARRRALITGQAGDRGDDDLREFALASDSLRFDRIFIKRMDNHARGRPIGEVANIMRDAYLGSGYRKSVMSQPRTEIDAVKAALRWAKTGDLIVLLSHEKRDQTQAFLQSRVE